MIVAATDWGEVIVAVALIAMIAVLGSGVVWQTLASGRSGRLATRESAYRALAEEAAELQRTTAEALNRVAGELGDLNRRTAALERLLEEVE